MAIASRSCLVPYTRLPLGYWLYTPTAILLKTRQWYVHLHLQAEPPKSEPAALQPAFLKQQPGPPTSTEAAERSHEMPQLAHEAIQMQALFPRERWVCDSPEPMAVSSVTAESDSEAG